MSHNISLLVYTLPFEYKIATLGLSRREGEVREGERNLVVLRELPPAPPARGRGGVQGRGRGEGDRFW